jgi:hypothetical protein
MAENVWRRRAPLWLRIVAGILLLPLLGLAVFFVAGVIDLDTPLVWILPIAAGLAVDRSQGANPDRNRLVGAGPLGSALMLPGAPRV